MKELVNYCTQERRYGDSRGKCVVQLENGDDADAIIKEYTKAREWYAQTYSNPVRTSHYEHRRWNGEVQSFDGDLIVFDTYRTYLD